MGLIHLAFAGAGEGICYTVKAAFVGCRLMFMELEKAHWKTFSSPCLLPSALLLPSTCDSPVHIGCSGIKSSWFTHNKTTLREDFGFKTPTVFPWLEFGFALTRNQELPQQLACDWHVCFRLPTFELFWFLTPLRNISVPDMLACWWD